MSLLEEAIVAHGGMERWREPKRIELKLRCGGIAIALKGRPGVLHELAASVDVRRPHVQFDRLGTFDGADGRPLRIARRLRWTDQDVGARRRLAPPRPARDDASQRPRFLARC